MGWNTPDELAYSETDEWVRIEDGIATIGITDFAQDQLSNVVFVELPEIGEVLARGDTFGAVESVKAAADLNAPISGEITSVNGSLENEPEMLNSTPFGDAWIIMVKVSDPSELEFLMDSNKYAQYCETRTH